MTDPMIEWRKQERFLLDAVAQAEMSYAIAAEQGRKNSAKVYKQRIAYQKEQLRLHRRNRPGRTDRG